MAAQDYEQVTYNSPDGAQIGSAASEKVGFWGATPATQRAGSYQATSVLGTASTTSLSTDHKAYLLEIGNTLIAYGFWKGSA